MLADVPWYLQEPFIGFVVAVIAAIWGLIKWLVLRKNKKWETIIKITEMVVTDLYHEEVRELKKVAKDGKLTKDDIKYLQKKAWEKIKEIAKEKGIDILKMIAEEYAPTWISKIVSRLKGKNVPIKD